MRNSWYVVFYAYKCKDGTTLYCAAARGFGYYQSNIAATVRADNSIVCIRPCETKKIAEGIAHDWNNLYKEENNLAMTYNFELHGGV